MYKSLKKDIKELQEKNAENEEKNKKLEKEIETLKAQNTSEIEGINNKLSSYAQQAIRSSRGPVPPDELLNFFTKDVFGKRNKETLALIRKYYNNVDGVKRQLSRVYETLESHMIYIKKQKQLDDKFIKTLENLEKTIEKEEEEGIRPDTKIMVQSKLDQYFEIKTDNCKVTQRVNFNIEANSPQKEAEQNNEKKPDESQKCSRKRKYRHNDDSSSSQESGNKNITARLRKRAKLCSSKSNTESSSSSEYMSVQELEAMSVSECSRSASSSSQENEVKRITSRFSKRVKLSSSKSNTESSNTNSSTENSSTNPNLVVNTVPEKHFYLRGKPMH